MKVKLQEIRPYVMLYRDSKTGIAWVENGEAGIPATPTSRQPDRCEA